MKSIRTLAAVWLVCALCSGAWCAPARAELPSFLRKENSAVNSGNEALQKGDAKGALEAYDRAARALPDSPGVQLNRGLALLKQGEYGKSREALLTATVPTASSEVRADAYHNLALSFYREADGLAGQDKHAEAQKLFREAVDAAKRSLHLRPSDPNTAWNLELARRRVREEEQKQKEQEQQKQDEKKEQDQQQNQDQKQDQDQKSDDKSDQPQDQKQDQQDQNKPEPDQNKDDQPKPDEQKPQDQADKQPPQQPDQKPAEPDSDKAEEPSERPLPREAAQALDSLKDSEENFERYRARQRATRERRAPEKDW